VTPDNPKTEDDLTCTITVPSVDPDGDPVTYRYRWYKDDVHQPPFDELDVVPASATAKGETWKCVVTPNDGTSDGWSGQDSVTLANAAPTQPTIDVTPNSPKPEDDLTCTITKPSTDPDGDTVTYRYRWYKGGVAQGDYDDQTTVPASATARGDIWKCVVTPTDGTDDGPSDEDQVAVDAPFLEWAGTPGYESDGVDPDIGNPQGASSPTTFTFKVKYTDPSGRPPQVRRCWIRKLADEGGWEACKTPNMTLESGTIETGAIYSCSVQLPGPVP
jgi:hypothetical protein